MFRWCGTVGCGNAAKFLGERPRQSGVWCRAERLWDLCKSVHEDEAAIQNLQVLKWQKPMAPSVKLNVDAGVYLDGSRTMGGVFKNSVGMIEDVPVVIY
ncbi:uncharacterized protein G2W53_009694 [Senna tora]|uniref:Uncharacterized protein n=1 Tax=Senna tora TaxID=362788 RepID=A0A834WYW3_9FABA|nr:uncharacterized protein G2W53_009694 [Senna tora]